MDSSKSIENVASDYRKLFNQKVFSNPIPAGLYAGTKSFSMLCDPEMVFGVKQFVGINSHAQP